MKSKLLELHLQECPLCGRNDFRLLKNNDRYFMGLRTVGCLKCGLVQTNPRPSEYGLNKFYSFFYRKYYQGVVTPSLSYLKKINKEHRLSDAVKFIQEKTLLNKNSSILDVGCSEGTMFGELRKAGFTGSLCGVELNKEFADYAKNNYKAEVYERLDDITEKFDLVTMNHVFEHLLNPIQELERMAIYIKEKGYIYIDVPDIEEYSNLNDLHLAHLFHYSSRTITTLMKIAGYEVVLCEKHTPKDHPKSLRILARPSLNKSNCHIETSDVTEKKTWDQICSISISKFSVIRNFISRIPFAKRFYVAIKKLVKH
jgi:2-polyprenyl-3-methyl-5-hydroxy-6-metoxy-1,4-benzoquinol methylase